MNKWITSIVAIMCFLIVWSCQNNTTQGNDGQDDTTVQTQTPPSGSETPPANTNTPQTSAEVLPTPPEGYTYFNGVFVEEIPSFNQDPNRYNADNKIYLPGKEFVYGYYYETADGKQLLAQNILDDSIPTSKAWQFVFAEQYNTLTITDIILTVQDGMGLLAQVRPGYNRTTVDINYKMPVGLGDFREIVGIIENEQGVWIYPPRQKVFGVLAMNPQPYIKAPYEVGNQWNWTFMVGAAYSDLRWIEWGGQLINECAYKITSKKMVDTPMGEMECFEVNAFGLNRLGRTQLTSYFNEEYGFVKMNYLNVDGSKIIILLKEVRTAEKK